MQRRFEELQGFIDFIENLWVSMPGTCIKFDHENMRMDVEIKVERVTGEGLKGQQTKKGPVCYNAPVLSGESRDHSDRDAYQEGDEVQIMFNSRATERLYLDLRTQLPPKFKRVLSENDAVIIGGVKVDHSVAWPGGPQSKAPPGYRDSKLFWYSKIQGQPYVFHVTKEGTIEAVTPTVRFDAYTILGGGGPRVHRLGDLDSDGDIAVTAATRTEAG